jgi:hypothetical protein
MTAEHPERDPDDAGHSDAEVRRALERAEAEAAEHNGDYAAGMRNARLIIEEALLG